MTKHFFLVSAAIAALIAGTGFACAQGAGASMNHGNAGSSIQQSAPSTESGGGSVTTPKHNGASDSKSSHEGVTRGSESKQHAQDSKPGKTQNEKSTDESGKSGASNEHSKSMRSETNESGKSEKNIRAEDRKGQAEDKNQRAGDRNGNGVDHNRGAEERNGTKSESSKSVRDTDRSSTKTTGQAGAGAKLSTEQRTKITTVIKNEHVRPETNVNFSISVGTRVPREVHFHPLPAEIVTVYPDWRGYEFFLVRDQIIVVNPSTLEIVAVLEV